MFISENVSFEYALELLAVNAYTAWQNTLSGCNSPMQQHYFERMRAPRIGELVLEITTPTRAKAIDRIGRLISITDEPRNLPDWNVAEDGPIPTKRIWTIETFDNRKFRWENCDFVVIPEDL